MNKQKFRYIKLPRVYCTFYRTLSVVTYSKLPYTLNSPHAQVICHRHAAECQIFGEEVNAFFDALQFWAPKDWGGNTQRFALMVLSGTNRSQADSSNMGK